ncbi:MAG: (deoxy)nucleoside triphosphate pyrophosphohydrolase [Mucilaginibacter sp.]|uniref:(deoxy)nucleoside triphosphate pyrophosphohydrolase n=1 Tax=Mucilaginibacter sp. TaxID=1882438 RepID=UPI0031A0CE27
MINVTCAIIVNADKQIFVAQRGPTMALPLKWELPGGKIEPSESEEDCLIREIKEELSIDIKIIKSLSANIHNYPKISIKLIPFICELIGGKIELKEHVQFKWLKKTELLDLDWAEADIPIVKNYIKSK